jgi:hypothetical protein
MPKRSIYKKKIAKPFRLAPFAVRGIGRDRLHPVSSTRTAQLNDMPRWNFSFDA